MPMPPNHDDFLEVNFITNYFLQGCVPPFWLFVEMANPAAERLLLLLLLPDMQDIGQAMFAPGGGRHRRPGRHGRKSGRGPGFPDVSDMIGEKVRGVVNPYDALDFGPVRKLFKLVNIYEGIAFSAALLEGVTDVGFEGLLGVMTLNPETCPNMQFIRRHTLDPEYVMSIIKPYNPLNLLILDQTQGFMDTTGFGTTNIFSDYRISLSAQCVGTYLGVQGLQFHLLDQDGNIRASSSKRNLDEGEFATLNVDAKFHKGESCTWVASSDFGDTWCPMIEVFGFSAKW